MDVRNVLRMVLIAPPLAAAIVVLVPLRGLIWGSVLAWEVAGDIVEWFFDWLFD